MSTLSQVERNSFEKNGFRILENVFNESELEPFRDLTTRIIEFHENDGRDPYAHPDCDYLDHRIDQGVLYDVCQRYPAYRRLTTAPPVLDAVEEIVGETVQLYDNTVVYKPKTGKNEVPFHQDFMSQSDDVTKVIAWMPMFDVTRENGCLKAIPGSHTEGTLSWHREEGETHHDRLDEDQYDESEAVYLEMDAGDVLLFTPNLIHGSDEVDVENLRYAYRAVYSEPSLDGPVVPRVGPEVLRGGDPQSLRAADAVLLPADVETNKDKHTARRVIHYLGRQLQRV